MNSLYSWNLNVLIGHFHPLLILIEYMWKIIETPPHFKIKSFKIVCIIVTDGGGSGDVGGVCVCVHTRVCTHLCEVGVHVMAPV